MSNLDTDFIFAEILPRLPTKSLIRFKCVSKSFKTFISSRGFIKLYNSLSSDAKDPRLIIPGDKRITLYDLDSTAAITTFHWRDVERLYVIGSSNGLICITAYFFNINKIFVLNPTTRIYKDIPMPDNIVGARRRNFGFAFDPQNLDFKIVVVSDKKKIIADYEDITLTRITKVYSLNTETWTEIKNELPGDEIVAGGGDCRCRGVLINNSLLIWKFWIPSSPKYNTACFDVCKSKWTYDVLLPPSCDEPIHRWNIPKLGVFDECLSLSYRERKKSSSVWVMKEYGVQDSWVKLMNVSISDALPIAYRRGSSEVLIRQNYTSWLFWYNMKNGEINDAKFDGAPNFLSVEVCIPGKSPIDLPGGKLFVDPDKLL